MVDPLTITLVIVVIVFAGLGIGTLLFAKRWLAALLLATALVALLFVLTNTEDGAVALSANTDLHTKTFDEETTGTLLIIYFEVFAFSLMALAIWMTLRDVRPARRRAPSRLVIIYLVVLAITVPIIWAGFGMTVPYAAAAIFTTMAMGAMSQFIKGLLPRSYTRGEPKHRMPTQGVETGSHFFFYGAMLALMGIAMTCDQGLAGPFILAAIAFCTSCLGCAGVSYESAVWGMSRSERANNAFTRVLTPSL